MTIQRMIDFTTDDAGAAAVEEALGKAFAALEAERPSGVSLTYWRADGNRFVALIGLDDDAANPLLGIDATAALPRVIGAHLPGGYPTPVVVEQVGSYGGAGER